MNGRFPFMLVLFLAVYLFVAGTSGGSSVGAYLGGPDPGVTGGFGEPTCNQSGCHSSFDLNAGRTLGLGDLLISGFPKQYEPGETYPIKLVVTHTQDRKVWGFQLAARVKATGGQAGTLQPKDGGTQRLEEKGVQYLEHTLDGSLTNTFSFAWVAPSSPAGEIVVDAAGNATDGGGSPDEDYIYSTSIAISPVR